MLNSSHNTNPPSRQVKGRVFYLNYHKVNESPFRVGSLNVGSMRGKASEVVETMSRRRVDLCCLQETHWKTNLKLIAGRDSRYKYFGCGNDEGTCGVGILLAEKWWKKVFGVIRVSDKIILIRMVVESVVFVFVSVYAPQANLSESVKDQFYYVLQSTIARVSSSKQLIIHGDWNVHIGSHSTVFEEWMVDRLGKKKP